MGLVFKRLVTSPMVGVLVSFEGFHGVVSQTPEIRDVRPPCVGLNVRFSVAPEVVGPGLSLFCGSYIQSASLFLWGD